MRKGVRIVENCYLMAEWAKIELTGFIGVGRMRTKRSFSTSAS